MSDTYKYTLEVTLVIPLEARSYAMAEALEDGVMLSLAPVVHKLGCSGIVRKLRKEPTEQK